MRGFLINLSALLLIHGVALGAFSKSDAGTSGAQFLKLGAGARATSMGGAFTGVADDATAVYWNPAGLSRIEKKSVSLMHALWFEDISYDWASYVCPAKIGSFGVGIQYVSYGALKGADKDGAETGNFIPADIALTMAYGRKISGIDAGISVKYIQSTITETATALAADLGVMKKMVDNKLSLGLAVQNIAGEMKFIEAADPLPLTIKVGVAYKFMKNLLVSADIIMPSDSGVNFAIGGEYAHRVNDDLSATLRLGCNTISKDVTGLSGITAGIGGAYKNYAIDYAFVPYGDLGMTHRVSLGVKF